MFAILRGYNRFIGHMERDVARMRANIERDGITEGIGRMLAEGSQRVSPTLD